MTKKNPFLALADTDDVQVALGLAGSHFKDGVKLVGVVFGSKENYPKCEGLTVSDPRVVKAYQQKWPISR